MSDNITDPETGLFSEAFLDAELPLRVATARRSLRQLGLVLVAYDARSFELGAVAEAARATLRDSDAACRLDDGRLALLLELTPVDGSLRAATRLRDALVTLDPEAQVWAGVATYPVHAIDDRELRAAAEEALARARRAERGTVEEAERPE
ncbi:MAG: diguanylate cyclase [Actinobacteria bacterium]|nr:diguanylate cyclase [Actinomycetota bacterium]